ncbi:ABC transporter permease subunit [Methylobacterium sp. 37f]|uniref:ABC transporter permease subunit n=1 Tax=Methylobacterium sp. 37f TaxID=2817058 RepID=UPI001FFD9385|nr:ABC transporter permease subunit [Methylobacterium sp. 37f]
MPARSATPPSIGFRWLLPILATALGFGALVLALTEMPFLNLAGNRLAQGRPLFAGLVLGGLLPVILALSGLALGLLMGSRRRASAGAAIVLLAGAVLALAYGLGDGAARSLGGLPPAARASLGPGSWFAAALLMTGVGLAVRRADRPGLGWLITLGGILGFGLLANSGAVDALSLAVEYAARREAVNAAIGEHLILSGAALGLAGIAAVLLSLPRRGQGVVAMVLTGVQVIPAVALLGALVAVTAGLLRALPVLRDLGLSALGPAPAIVAIAAYLALPLWRGLALALRSPDHASLEAAEAMGLSPRQILIRLRLQLGAPILVGALRVAAVQSLGLATLGALVGAGGLGRIVFDGMAQFAPDLILLGAIPVVALSLGTERGLSAVEAAARRRWHA